MARKRDGKTTEKLTVIVRGIGPARPKKRKDPGQRGRHPHSVANRFKPGNQFGKHPQQRIPKFADAYETSLLGRVPEKLRRQLGLPKGSTMMDLLVARVVHEATVNGSLPHVQELREVTQGKVPNKNLSLSVELEAYAENEEFRKFIAERYAEFLSTRPQGRLTTGDAEV